MNYTQVIAPDLNTVGDIGWCLAFVEKAYNDTNYSYATARDGWDACQFIHPDRNLPTDVSVPIWFDYYEAGINYGHVAINVPGRGILSSPYKADNTQQWLPSIDTISKAYHCTYLGWSEDLMGVRVIKQGDNVMQADIDELNKQLNQTNTYLQATQTAVGELTKQLDSTNTYLDALTKRVTVLEGKSTTSTSADGDYHLTKIN